MVRAVVGAQAEVYVVPAPGRCWRTRWRLAPTVAICVNSTPSVERSSLKPASLIALSVQVRLIELDETAAALRLLVRRASRWVVAEAMLENAEWFGPS